MENSDINENAFSLCNTDLNLAQYMKNKTNLTKNQTEPKHHGKNQFL